LTSLSHPPETRNRQSNVHSISTMPRGLWGELASSPVLDCESRPPRLNGSACARPKVTPLGEESPHGPLWTWEKSEGRLALQIGLGRQTPAQPAGVRVASISARPTISSRNEIQLAKSGKILTACRSGFRSHQLQITAPAKLRPMISASSNATDVDLNAGNAVLRELVLFTGRPKGQFVCLRTDLRQAMSVRLGLRGAVRFPPKCGLTGLNLAD